MSSVSEGTTTIPDQPTDRSAPSLPPEQRTEFTPEEKVEFDEFMAKINQKLDRLEASADRTLILMGIKP